jgi:hypothetical protein
MTTFGWDASSWDSVPKSRDGLDFYTHKITDGDHFYVDTTFPNHIAAARGLGIPVLGSYHVLHGQRNITSQADWWISLVNGYAPWWRSQPAWIWQCDAEPFGYNITPSVDEINALGDLVCQRLGIPSSSYVAYAPQWVYGAELKKLRYRQWQSNYGSNPSGPYRALYPGDTSTQWAGPVDPIILQYGSNSVIAGQTTSDANAYRGTVDQLIADLGGNVTTLDSTTRWGSTYATLLGDMWWAEFKGNSTSVVQQSLARVEASIAANEVKEVARDAALTSLIQAVATGGPGGLTDAQLAALVSAVRDAASQAAAAAQAAIMAKTDALHAQLLAQAQAAATALSANI